MPLVLDSKIDIADAATITLAGREFFVPLLVFRQVVKIGPHMPAILKTLNRVMPAALRLGGEKEAIAAGGEPISQAERYELMEGATLTDAELDVAIKTIVAALTRAYPKATADDILDLPIRPGEILVALPKIIRQVHGMEVEDEAPGKDQAAS